MGSRGLANSMTSCANHTHHGGHPLFQGRRALQTNLVSISENSAEISVGEMAATVSFAVE